jgi:hypothetical protein
MNMKSGGLSPTNCQKLAAQCRALTTSVDTQPVRIMLEHIARTWEQIAEELSASSSDELPARRDSTTERPAVDF